MIETILNYTLILFLISIAANILTNQFDPLEWIKKKIGLGIEREVYSKYFVIDMIIYTIWKLLNCPGCISYWITVLWFLPGIEGIYLGLISYTLSTWLYNNIFTTKINF